MKEFRLSLIEEIIQRAIKTKYIPSGGYGPGMEIIAGHEESAKTIQKEIINDLKRRAKEARKAAKGDIHKTHESRVADFIDTLIKEWGA